MLMTLLPMILAAGPAPESPPIACRSDALTPAERQRQQTLLARVGSATEVVEELDDGYALRLPPDPRLFGELAEWVGLERRCCPFAGFVLEWSDADVVTVRVTGGPGVKPVLEAELLAAGWKPGSP